MDDIKDPFAEDADAARSHEALANGANMTDQVATLLVTYRGQLLGQDFNEGVVDQLVIQFSQYLWQSSLVEIQKQANAHLQRLMSGQEAADVDAA